MSAITAKASRKMKKYAVLTREPRCFLGSFDFSWEQRKLSEMCGTFEYGLNAAAKEFDGNNKYIRITDIDDASREFLLSDLSSPDICLDGMSKYLLSSGDIVFARTGASVGKTYIYRENDGIVYFAGFLIRAKVNQDNDAEFVFQSTLSPSYEKYIRITSQRSGQPGVNAQEYGEYDLFAPSKEEQQRIGHFLRGIDNLITLHQRKFEKLTNVKKSMLEKMFPQNGSSYPEIRFKGFTDPWEQRKLGDISEIKTGPFGSTLHADDYVSDGTPIITTEHFKTGALPRSKNGLPQVSDSDYKRLTAYTLDAGDIVFSRVGSVDINALITPFQSNWLFSGRVLRVRPQTDVSSQFLHTRLETESIKTDIRTRAVGQTMPSINTEILKITPLVLPSSVAEQEQIGSYFAALDNLITLHQRELDKLQKIKKSMLEKMFV